MTESAPAPVTVRRIRPGEGQRWRALRLRALADTPAAYVDTVESARARPESAWHDAVARLSAGCDGALFIAESGADWVGVAGGFADEHGGTTVFTVFVEPATRGRGVVDGLIDAVADWSARCGRHNLSLEVGVENPRAHAAYRRLGFAATGASRPHPLYPELTEIEMVRPVIG
ncbi:MAG: GNAT family N-acetyltransferase [Pseudonocardiales bacterium]|nr:MAG: GNAT family N-acetyltransferase [Pseudonocardiales bacterium]